MNDICKAYSNDLVQSRPVKSKKVKVRKRIFNYLIFSHEDQLLINQRSENDIWQGLYDFYNIEGDLGEVEIIEELSSLLTKLGIVEFNVFTISDIYKHKLTHQHLEVRFFEIHLALLNDLSNLGESLGLLSMNKAFVNSLGKPIIISNYLNNNYL
jgi:A/G-specific adenine glycosylase